MDANLISKEKSLPSVLAWLKATYEYRHGDATPKREVYKAYKQFCIHHNLETTNAPAFGKILRMVFPTISSRRLGKRGQTSHHYNNFRKRADAPPITAALSYYFHSFPAHAAPPLPPLSSSFMASPSSSNNNSNNSNGGFHSRSQSSSPPLSSSSPASSMHSPITASTTAYFYNHSAPNLPSTTAAADGRNSPQQKQHYPHHPPHHYSSAPSSSSFSPTPSAAAPSSTKPSSSGYSQQDLNHISRSIHQLHQSLNNLSQHQQQQQQHQSNDPPQHSPPPPQQQHQIQSHSFPIQHHLQDRCSSSPSPSSYPSSSSSSSSSIYYSTPSSSASSSSSSQQYHHSSTYSPPPSHSHSRSHSPPTQHPRSQPHSHSHPHPPHSSTSPPVLHQRNHHHSSPEFSPSHHRVYEERPPPQQHRSQHSHHHYHQQQHYHHQQQPLPPSSYSNSRPYHSPPQSHHYATAPAAQFNQHEQHLSLDSLPSSATSSTGTIATASSNSSNGEEDRRSYSSLPPSNTVASVPTTAASTIRTNSNAATTDTPSYDVSTYSGLNLLRDRTSKDFTAMMDSNITPYYPLPPYAKRRRSSLLLAAEDPTSTPLPIPEPLIEADHLSNGSHLPPPLILPQPRQSFSSLTLRYREDAIGGAKVPELNDGRRGGIGEDKNTRRLEEWDELTSLHFPFNEGHRGSIFGISGSYLASGVVSGRRRSSIGLALGYSGPPWMMTAPAAVSVAPSASSAGPYASTTTNPSTTGDNTVVNRGGGEGESFNGDYDASMPPLLPAERGQVPQFVLNTMELADEELRQQARLFNTMYRNHFQLIFDALCNNQKATILDSNDTNDRRRKRQRVASASFSSMGEQWQENNHQHDTSSSLKRTKLGENTKEARNEELRKNRSENDIGAKNRGQEEEEHRGGQKELDDERRTNEECKDGAMCNSENCSFDFDAVANYLKQFWPQTKSFYHLFTQEVIIEQIVEIDAMLYSSMLGLLMPYLFQSLPSHVTDQIVWFAQVFVGWVKDAAAAHIPILLLDMKLKVAENFSKALLSRAAINRLSSRLREALAQEASLPREDNMLSDWERVDFTYVDGQTTSYGDFRKIPQTIKEGFPPLLSQHLQVEDWARWVMQVSERVMKGFYSPYIPTIPEFLLKWTTYCSLLESCLTVQAAKNMRSFVLLFRWLEALLTLYLDEQEKSKRWNEQIVEEEQRNSQQLWQRRMSETAMQQPRFSAIFGSFSFGTMNAAAPPGYNVWENFNSNIRAVGQLHRLQEIAEEPGREENQVAVGLGNERISQLNIQNNKRAEDSHQHQLLLMNGHHVGLDEHPARDRMEKSTMPYHANYEQRRKESLPGTSSFCNIPSGPGSSGGTVNGSGGGLIPGIHDTFGMF